MAGLTGLRDLMKIYLKEAGLFLLSACENGDDVKCTS